jgi:adenine-specific DNA-methyltransferase
VDGKGRALLRQDLPDLEFWVGKRIARGRPSMKTYLDEQASQDVARPISSWVASGKDPDIDESVINLEGERQGVGTDVLMKIFGDKSFEFPKPPGFLRQLVAACTVGDELILDFFAGSGTTGHSVLLQNSEDDANRRFILVSNTEATLEKPEKNLCRDVCAERIRRVISGYGDVAATGGDFAYLRARRISWDDVVYDLDAASIWTLIQLRYDRAILPFDGASAVQVSMPTQDDTGSPALAFVPEVSEAAVEQLRALASVNIVSVFTPAPGNLRDLLGMPNVAIEQIPDRLLAEFPRHVAGL